MSRIDDILSGLANYIVESIHLQPTPVEMKKLNQKQAKSELLQVLLEVIGEDEPDETDKWTPEMESYIRQARQVIYGRNALKAEQRKRAKELFGVEE